MGSGLSMASVNKIKELAEQREYSLALDIVDSQDLSRSLNPQFLRICGDIYMHNARYADSRRILLMAHKLAPESKRVIYSLTYLYLLMGYKDLAKKYFDLYMFDADETGVETQQIKYIYSKADNASDDELFELLSSEYVHNMDYDWSFETYLLLKKMKKDSEAKVLAGDYIATYKNTANSEHIADIESGKESYDIYYDVFLAESVLDDDPKQDELRREEAVLLEADNLRVNPKDAEITIVVDDFEEVDMGTKRRLKKMLKSEEKKKNKEQQEENNNSEETEKNDTDDADEVKEAEPDEETETAEDTETVEENTEKKSKVSFLKKVFSKKHIDDDVEAVDDSEQTDEEISTETDTLVDDALPEEEVSEQKEDTMQELHMNRHNPKVSIDFGSDDFTAESDTIEDLKDEDFSNPFDEITVLKKEKEEPIFVPKRKKEFSFDDIDFSSGDDEEFEVDDFSIPDDEFGSMTTIESEAEPEEEIEAETEPEEEIEAEAEPEEEIEAETEPEEEIEAETEPEEEVEAEAEPEEEIEAETEPEEEVEAETEPEEEVEAEAEPEEEVEAEAEPEEEIEAEAEPEEEVEAEAEPEEEIEAEAEPEEEVEVEAEPEEEVEVEAEPETEPEEEVEVEAEPEEEVETETQTDIQSYTGEEAGVSADIDIPIQEEMISDMSKHRLDFPVFRSSLFPNHNRVVKQVENNFNEIMEKGQDKLQENLLKEEQMQREAEALLASLGIDLGGIEVSNDSMESINKTLYDEPSRDELKASLKIDSVKKDILKKIKEYR